MMKRSTTKNLLNFPEEVLFRILCFLPQKQALQTCLLSKSWRHLGSTRSKLEFSLIDDFNGDYEKFTSVLYNTLQRYNHQNLPIHQLCLKLNFTLPTIPFKFEFVQELYLQNCDLRLIDCADDNFNTLLKHLRKLSLDRVFTSNESLGILLSRCPLIEYLRILNDYKGLTILSETKPRNLKHVVCLPDYIPNNSIIEIDVPTLETIRITKCSSWYFHDDNYFPHLRSVYLENVRLFSESLSFFTPNCMPSLEELQLHQCYYGSKELHLSSPSIKRLHITCMTMPIKATIDAPNIVYFELKAFALPSIYFTPISREWKSHIDLPFFVSDRKFVLPMILELNEVLKALSQSQITLNIYLRFGFHHHIEDSAYGGLYNNKPVDVERLSLELHHHSSSTVPFIFNYVFRVCRPRYIYAAHTLAHRRELTARLREVLLHERERSDYFWNQDLVEVSIETYCDGTNEWRPVHGNTLSESALHYNQKIGFGLKWRA